MVFSARRVRRAVSMLSVRLGQVSIVAELLVIAEQQVVCCAWRGNVITSVHISVCLSDHAISFNP